MDEITGSAGDTHRLFRQSMVYTIVKKRFSANLKN
jgi:hypothetical protein